MKLESDAYDAFGTTSKTALNHRGFMQFHANVNNSAATSVSVSAEYWHQELVVGVTPSLSFDGFNITIEPSLGFKFMDPNPYLSFDV